MFKKRVFGEINLIVGLLLVLSLIGCGDSDSGDPSSPPGDDTPATELIGKWGVSGIYELTINANGTGSLLFGGETNPVSVKGNTITVTISGQTGTMTGTVTSNKLSLSNPSGQLSSYLQTFLDAIVLPLDKITSSSPDPNDPPGPGTEIAARYRAEEKNIYQGSGGLYHGTQFWNYYEVTVHANSITFYTDAPLFNPDITITGASTNGGADIYIDYANLGMVITTGRWDYVFEGDYIIGFLYDYTVTTNGTPTTISRGLWLGDSAIVQAPPLSLSLFLDPSINADFIQPTSESGYDVGFTDSAL